MGRSELYAAFRVHAFAAMVAAVWCKDVAIRKRAKSVAL
jgi:hypothetical protein